MTWPRIPCSQPLNMPDMFEYSSSPTMDWEWSMTRYESALYDRAEKGDDRAKDAWDELEKSRERFLYIDHRHRGLGSNSCGPQPEAEYELPMGPFAWEFRIR